MFELVQPRLSRATRDWFSDTELSGSADAYVQHLLDGGYASATIQMYLESVAHFARWLTKRRIHLAELNEVVVRRFLERHLPACRCARRCQRGRHIIRAALVRLLELLRASGQITPKRSLDPAPIAEELCNFEHYLKNVCGLSPTTRLRRLKLLRAFLLDRFGSGCVRLSTLNARDVAGYVAKCAADWAPSSKKQLASTLRSYFRFKALSGERTESLSVAIPRIAQWRVASLPKSVSGAEIAKLLNTFDRSSATGRRDYAITRCFVDLGLRTAEIARLRLEDVDWREGTLRIRGKGRRIDVLPLPQVTGIAIVDYLRNGRPATTSRALFIRHRPPLATSVTASIVRNAVRYAAKRCGLERCLNGPYPIRHSVAKRLLQSGATLKQIADVLRHRCLDTTTIYTKIDFPALARVALPWPGR